MKKGLLSILAGALLVVGCQNYDDQFNSIENSINALKTQVDGLSAVSSQLTSLSSTVQSLSTTVSSLPSSSEIATQISTGLAGIIEDVADLEAAVAAADSSDAVAAIQADITAQEETLAELLANSSVFTGQVTINSVATLDAFYQMRTGLSIVNGGVSITVYTDMDQTKVQAVVDEMLTIIGDLTYDSDASSIAETTFDNLTGVTNIDIKQAGGYRFPVLLAATDVTLRSNFESTVAVIDFRSATSIGSFHTDSTTSTIEFTKATELHLTALERYDTSASVPLKLIIDEGGALPITALDDVDTDGDQEDIYLEITGPSAVTIENFEDGSLTFTDVPTVVVNNFLGTIITSTGVESLSANSVVGSITLGADLETVSITGVVDADDDDNTGPAITITDHTNIESLTVAGDVTGVSVSGATNLLTAVISADVEGTISFNNNDDLETLTLTDSEADAVSITGNDTLVSLTIDTTNSDDDGSVIVTDNTDLESLTISYDAVETLTITGNDDLTTVDLSGITSLGATEAPSVAIFDNDLTASATDSEDTTATANAVAATDLGSFTTDSGLDTLATYLALVAAETATASATVFFDTVESFTNEDGDEFTDITWSASSAGNDQNGVLYMRGSTAEAAVDATYSKRSFIIDADSSDSTVDLWVNDTQIVDNLDISSSGNPSVLASSAYLLDADMLASATAAGVTITATPYAGEDIAVELAIGPNSSASENSATAVTSAFAFNVSDTFTIALGSDISLTVSSSAATTSTDTLANSIITRYLALYPSASAAIQYWTVASEAGVAGNYGADHVVIRFTSKGHGSRDIGKTLVASHSSAKVATYSNVGIKIGNSESQTSDAGDNIARGSDVMITFTSAVAGSSLSTIGHPGQALAGAAVSYTGLATTATELNSNLLAVAETNVASSTQLYPNQERDDVVNPESGIAAESDNDTFYTRVGWL
ncbi:hypothetical protein N9F74_02015 [Flavobacteriaceae bacterium]|nr:hypothetical protein [Flavobacteriaceae bacterium]